MACLLLTQFPIGVILMILVPGKGKDVLLDLINQANIFPVPLNIDDLKFDKPNPVLGKLPTTVEVEVIPMPDTTYEGGVKVDYQRMDLTSAFKDIIPRTSGLSEGDLRSMIPYISKELGVYLDPNDFEQVDYSWMQADEEANIRVRALPTSLSYIGEFFLLYTRLRMTMDLAVKVRDLDVLLHPGAVDPDTDKPLIDVRTYSEDFSEYRHQLRRHSFQPYLFADTTAVRQVMETVCGFPYWPNNQYFPSYDYATSQVPEANQDYDRVIIQTIYDSQFGTYPYQGHAYLHYNVND